MEKEVRLIDADKLKNHYAWWENGTAEMTLAEAKKNFDVIIDVQPTVEITAEMVAEYCRPRCLAIVDSLFLQSLYNRRVREDSDTVRHGHWVENNGRYGWYCSQCKKENNYAYDYNENNVIELQDHYCPHCGAKMDGERREDAETD